MFDFRLKVFYTVAKRLNFTKAANELYISQPAVTKHIKEIEQYFNCKLFDRSGNKVALTIAGKTLMNYAEKVSGLYQELSTEIAQLNKKNQGFLRMGISTTAAQYILPQYLANFKAAFPNISLEVHTANTENIEHLLNENKIEIGIVEGKTKRSGFTYTTFIKDEIVLCTHFNTPTKGIIPISQLNKLSFILREPGSGSLEHITAVLKKNKIILNGMNIEIVLENNESIKNYLRFSNAYAFISVFAITEELKSCKLKIIDIENLAINRYYYFVTKKGIPPNTAKLFMKFAYHNNLKL